jgi:hypothetical protein
LHRHGTDRETASMSSRVTPTPASTAAASRCSTVFVDPPMATSTANAFRNADRFATARGSTASSSLS